MPFNTSVIGRLGVEDPLHCQWDRCNSSGWVRHLVLPGLIVWLHPLDHHRAYNISHSIGRRFFNINPVRVIRRSAWASSQDTVSQVWIARFRRSAPIYPSMRLGIPSRHLIVADVQSSGTIPKSTYTKQVHIYKTRRFYSVK